VVHSQNSLNLSKEMAAVEVEEESLMDEEIIE